LVTADGKSKIINSSSLSGDNVYVCGYALSPYENRALVVVAARLNLGFMDWATHYDLIGFHLKDGFK